MLIFCLYFLFNKLKENNKKSRARHQAQRAPSPRRAEPATPKRHARHRAQRAQSPRRIMPPKSNFNKHARNHVQKNVPPESYEIQMKRRLDNIKHLRRIGIV